MRNSIYILGFLFASLSLFSCEKVIDIEFNASEALIVIEGERLRFLKQQIFKLQMINYSFLVQLF